MEEYILQENLISEEDLKIARVDFNLIKEEKSFVDFLCENNYISHEQCRTIEKKKLMGPEKIRIRFVRKSPEPERKGASTTQYQAPIVTESLMDTQTILVELFDRYDILEVAGRGAMSWVYKVKVKETGEVRALKILKCAEFADDDQLKRFSREAKVVKSLNHPNIVKLYECGEAMGIPYYTMDCIEGSTFEDYLASGPVSQDKGLEIMEKIARAIHAAHIEGVVHRDLKPSNIMITIEGEPLLVDFGIAKIIGLESSNLTRTGITVGTPAYMAPEQALGRFTDHRGDIFSMGTILYETFTGYSPFTDENAILTCSNILTKEPDRPSRLKKSISLLWNQSL
jgi:tRNA A-37 threonylcarbamoyl transferase component Bud32